MKRLDLFGHRSGVQAGLTTSHLQQALTTRGLTTTHLQQALGTKPGQTTQQGGGNNSAPTQGSSGKQGK